MRSIRRHLLLVLLSALALTGALIGTATYLLAWNEFDGMRDDELAQVAYSVARHGMPAEERPPASDPGQILSQIWDDKGNLIYTSSPETDLPLQPFSGLNAARWRGHEWRVYALRAGGKRTVQVAHSVAAREARLRDVVYRLLWPLAASLPLFGLFVWWTVNRDLAPLKHVRRQLDDSAPGALSPVTIKNLPEEISPMVGALNRLLERLDAALAGQKRFIADAAHELRSPLTALKLQVQLARRAADGSTARDAALGQLEAAVDRASHLVRQLLDLARAEPDAAAPRPQPVDLAALARDGVAECYMHAEAKSIDAGVIADRKVTVMGDAAGLRILLRNLVDNALRYSRAGDRVDVIVDEDANGAWMEVRDTGPGIPLEERARVFDRFYRGEDHAAEGSGLGLAIVKAIAQSHEADVTLNENPGGGLRVAVRFKYSGAQTANDT